MSFIFCFLYNFTTFDKPVNDVKAIVNNVTVQVFKTTIFVHDNYGSHLFSGDYSNLSEQFV